MSPQSLQSVRILGTTEMKHVPIHTDQGRIPIVYWSDIERQFPHATLAIFAGTGLDFVRNKNNQVLVPLRIKAQHPSEIVVQLNDSDGRQVLRDMEKYHAENIAERKKGQAMIDNVLLNVKTDVRALLDLPNHTVPRLFIVVPEPTSKHSIFTNNIADMVSRSYRLLFLCECGDSVAAAASTIDGGVSHKMHFAHHEGYEIRTPKAFIQKYGRHMIKVLDAIQTLATIGGALSPAILNASKLPANIQKALKSTDDNCLPRIKYIADHLENVLSLTDDTIDSSHCQVLDGPGLRAVESFLVKKDDDSTFGNLHRVMTPDNKIKWVCEQHVTGNVKVKEGVLRHTIKKFGGTLDEERGLVTVRLSFDDTEEFFRLIGSDSAIQELDITLDFDPPGEQIQALIRNIMNSMVSSLSMNIDTLGSNYIVPGIVQSLSACGQLLELLELHKEGKSGSFRNLAIKGVPNILEEYEFENSQAHSLALDRASFNWDREMSRRRLLDLLDKSPYLSRLQLCSSTLSEAYAMVRVLAKKSDRPMSIRITTDYQERVEFSLEAGSIENIAATVQASELGTVATWGDNIEKLTVLEAEGPWPWNVLETIVFRSQCLSRLDLPCHINEFCSVFERIKATVGPKSSLKTLCLRHGESKLLTKDLSNPTTTTTINMLPEEERHLGLWSTFSLFGIFPAYDAEPCLLTEEQFMTLQNHFSRNTAPVRLKELNLDVSNLTRLELLRLSDFFDQYKDIRVRVSGSWTRDIHNILLSNLGARLTGFDMTVHLSGTSPLANGATSLFKVYHLMQRTVSIPKARLRFMTKSGNAIVIKDLRDPKSASFDIICNDEPIDIALTRYFGCLPSELFDHDELFDINPPIVEF